MKIALVLHRYFPYGGLQRDFLRIAQECLLRGHQLIVYCQSWEGEKLADIKIIELPSKGLSNHQRAKQFFEKAQKDWTRQKVECVFGFDKMPGLDWYYAADVCYAEKSRDRHSFLYRFTSRYRQSVAFEEAVFSDKSRTKVFMISANEIRKFQKHYQTPSQRFILLPPGIDKNRSPPQKEEIKIIRKRIREQLGIKKHETMLLQVASKFKTKGVDRTVKLLSEIRNDLNAKVYVVGDDNALPYKKMAKKLGVGDRVIFLGARDDVTDLMLASDVLVHFAYSENTGTVILEAIIAGLPAIATDVCGYAHYINESQCGGVLSSPYCLAEALIQVLFFSKKEHRSRARIQGQAFGNIHDLYSMPQTVVDTIEGESVPCNLN